jgi:ribose 1,5-bisphosphokinase PhnN
MPAGEGRESMAPFTQRPFKQPQTIHAAQRAITRTRNPSAWLAATVSPNTSP